MTNTAESFTAQSFDLMSPDFKRDPGPTCAAILAEGPIVPVRVPIAGNIKFVTSHAAVDRLLKATDDFSVDLVAHGTSGIARFIRWTPGPLRQLSDNMLQKDDPEHRRLRKLVDGAFRRAEIERMRGQIADIADRLIDDLLRAPDGDLVRHVARDLPLAVICEMLGLPHADRPKFTRWMAGLSNVNSLTGLMRLLPSISRINAYLGEVFKQRRAVPRDDLISTLIQREVDGDRLSGNDLLAMCFLLFVAGHETTTHLISGGVLALIQNPDELARLRADPQQLATGAADELLRHVSPVQMTKPRLPLRDLSFEGMALRKGEMVMALLASANRDPSAFDAPDTLDITRTPNRHLAFGAGPHFCLGAWLARAEMEILLQRLLERIPDLRLAVPETDLRWRKGSGMRALESLPLAL